jgi:hypothetical protein
MPARGRQVKAPKVREKIAQGVALGYAGFIFSIRAGSMPARLRAADLDREMICERGKDRRALHVIKASPEEWPLWERIKVRGAATTR